MKKYVVLLISLTILLQFACKSTQKLYEDGKYEKIFSTLASKADKAKLSADERTIFLKAIDDWSKDQAKELNTLLETNEPKDWKSGLSNLEDIAKLQNKFESYPQIRTRDYSKLDVAAFEEEFNIELYKYHQYFFNDFFEKYDATQDKREIIRAYGELEEMRKYNDNRSYHDSLENVCLELGHRNFVVKIDNRTIGNNFEFSTSFLNRIDLRNDKWSSYYKSLNDTEIDYEINIFLTDIREDDRQVDRVQSYSREIQDGYETRVDTSGRSVEVPVYRTVTAQVNEIGFTYIVQAQAKVDIYNKQSRRREYDEYFRDESYDEEVRNYLRSGDNRAVPSSIRLETGSPYTNINNYNYSRLIEDVLEKLANAVEYEVRRF